jgi:hypothetical protein
MEIGKTLRVTTPQSWKNFQRFPKWYQRVRLGWLDASHDGPEIFRVRLRSFLKMTELFLDSEDQICVIRTRGH